MKKLTGTCTHCQMPIEFPAESIGLQTQCPYCRKMTDLLLATPPQESAIPAKALLWSAVAAVILALGLLGSVVALKRAQKLADRHPHQARPASTNVSR